MISRLKVRPRKLRSSVKVSFRLSKAAKVKLTLKRGKHTARTIRRFYKKKGAHSIKLKRRHLRRGRYTLTLVATDKNGLRSKPKRTTLRVVRR